MNYRTVNDPSAPAIPVSIRTGASVEASATRASASTSTSSRWPPSRGPRTRIPATGDTTSFDNQEWGQGAAIAFLLFLIIVVLTLIQRWVLRDRDEPSRRRRRMRPLASAETKVRS